MIDWQEANIINKNPLIVRSLNRGDIRGLYSWEDGKHIFYELFPIGKATNPDAIPVKLPKGAKVLEHNHSGVLSIYKI